jgi:hypothetical protein
MTPSDPAARPGPEPVSEPIEEYLDALLVASAGAEPRQSRYLLAEVDAHLHDAAAEAVAAGRGVEEAERDAVRRFGPVTDVARQEAARQSLPIRALWRPIVGSALLLGGLAGAALGLSAVITAVMGSVGGSTFIVNITSHTYLAPSDCARWLSQNPSAHTCYRAALDDWAFEAVAYRAVLGLAGLGMLAVLLLLRRRWRTGGFGLELPRPFVDAIGCTVFTAVSVWLVGVGVDALIVSGGHGAGQGLGTAPPMLALALVFGLRLVQDLRNGPMPGFGLGGRPAGELRPAETSSG